MSTPLGVNSPEHREQLMVRRYNGVINQILEDYAHALYILQWAQRDAIIDPKLPVTAVARHQRIERHVRLRYVEEIEQLRQEARL